MSGGALHFRIVIIGLRRYLERRLILGDSARCVEASRRLPLTPDDHLGKAFAGEDETLDGPLCQDT